MPDGRHEHKQATTSPSTGDGEGIVEFLAAVTGVEDSVGDIITPGAFSRTLGSVKPKVCANHSWNSPIGKTLAVKELMPGDPNLPSRTSAGQPWPADAGALWVRAQYAMSTQAGRDAYEMARFYGPEESAYSIGYKTRKARNKRGVRHIDDLDLFEYGPVLHGANNLAMLQSVKSAGDGSGMETTDIPAGYGVEFKIRYVRDVAYWGLPYGTPIMPGMRPRGPKALRERREGRVPDPNVGTTSDPDTDNEVSENARARQRERDEAGLFAEPEPGPERVRARRARGRDAAHVEALLDAIDRGHNEYARRGAVSDREEAIDDLLDEGITPDELAADLQAARHTDTTDDEIDEAVAEYRQAYRRRARVQAAGDDADELPDTDPAYDSDSGEDGGTGEAVPGIDRGELAETVTDAVRTGRKRGKVDSTPKGVNNLLDSIAANTPEPYRDDMTTAVNVAKSMFNDRDNTSPVSQARGLRELAQAQDVPLDGLARRAEMMHVLGDVLAEFGVADAARKGKRPIGKDIHAYADAVLAEVDTNTGEAHLMPAEDMTPLSQRQITGVHNAAHDAINDHDTMAVADALSELGVANGDQVADQWDRELSRSQQLAELDRLADARRNTTVPGDAELNGDEDDDEDAGQFRTAPRKPEAEQAAPEPVNELGMTQAELTQASRRADARQVRARNVAAEQARIDKRRQQHQQSLEIAASAPERIDADLSEFGEKSSLVADGRLVMSKPNTAKWSLRTAGDVVVASASQFSHAGSRSSADPKVSRAALEDLSARLAALRDSQGNLVPFTSTAAPKEWVNGWRDEQGRDLKQATSAVIEQWAADNGLSYLMGYGSAMREPVGFPGRDTAGGEVDAPGFTLARPVAEVAPGDEVRGPSGQVKTVARIDYSAGGQRRIILDDGTELRESALPTSARGKVVDIRFAGDPDSEQARREPSMGMWAEPRGGDPDEIRLDEPERRQMQRQLDPLTPAGTRFLYTPEPGPYGEFDDNRVRVGTVTDRVTNVQGEWYQVVAYDDGSYSAMRKLDTIDAVTLNPTDEQIADARAAWGLDGGEPGSERVALADVATPEQLITAYEQQLETLDPAVAPGAQYRRILSLADPSSNLDDYDDPDPSRLVVAESGIGAVATGDKREPWRVFTVGSAQGLPLDTLLRQAGFNSRASMLPKSRKRVEAWIDAVELVRDADGNLPPYGSPGFTSDDVKAWRDGQGRGLMQALTEVAVPAYLEWIDKPEQARTVLERFGLAEPSGTSRYSTEDFADRPTPHTAEQLIDYYRIGKDDPSVPERVRTGMDAVLQSITPDTSDSRARAPQPNASKLIVDGDNGLAARPWASGKNWTIFAVGSSRRLPIDDILGEARVRDSDINSRRRVLAMTSALGALRDSEGNPPPFGSVDADWVADWRDDQGRSLADAVRAEAIPNYLDAINRPQQAQRMRERYDESTRTRLESEQAQADADRQRAEQEAAEQAAQARREFDAEVERTGLERDNQERRDTAEQVRQEAYDAFKLENLSVRLAQAGLDAFNAGDPARGRVTLLDALPKDRSRPYSEYEQHTDRLLRKLAAADSDEEFNDVVADFKFGDQGSAYQRFRQADAFAAWAQAIRQHIQGDTEIGPALDHMGFDRVADGLDQVADRYAEHARIGREGASRYTVQGPLRPEVSAPDTPEAPETPSAPETPEVPEVSDRELNRLYRTQATISTGTLGDLRTEQMMARQARRGRQGMPRTDVLNALGGSSDEDTADTWDRMDAARAHAIVAGEVDPAEFGREAAAELTDSEFGRHLGNMIAIRQAMPSLDDDTHQRITDYVRAAHQARQAGVHPNVGDRESVRFRRFMDLQEREIERARARNERTRQRQQREDHDRRYSPSDSQLHAIVNRGLGKTRTDSTEHAVLRATKAMFTGEVGDSKLDPDDPQAVDAATVEWLRGLDLDDGDLARRLRQFAETMRSNNRGGDLARDDTRPVAERLDAIADQLEQAQAPEPEQDAPDVDALMGMFSSGRTRIGDEQAAAIAAMTPQQRADRDQVIQQRLTELYPRVSSPMSEGFTQSQRLEALSEELQRSDNDRLAERLPTMTNTRRAEALGGLSEEDLVEVAEASAQRRALLERRQRSAEGPARRRAERVARDIGAEQQRRGITPEEEPEPAPEGPERPVIATTPEQLDDVEATESAAISEAVQRLPEDRQDRVASVAQWVNGITDHDALDWAAVALAEQVDPGERRRLSQDLANLAVHLGDNPTLTGLLEQRQGDDGAFQRYRADIQLRQFARRLVDNPRIEASDARHASVDRPTPQDQGDMGAWVSSQPEMAEAVGAIINPRTTKADRAEALQTFSNASSAEQARLLAAWPAVAPNTRTPFDAEAASSGVDRWLSNDRTYPPNVVGQRIRITGESYPSKDGPDARSASSAGAIDNGVVTGVFPAFVGRKGNRRPAFRIHWEGTGSDVTYIPADGAVVDNSTAEADAELVATYGLPSLPSSDDTATPETAPEPVELTPDEVDEAAQVGDDLYGLYESEDGEWEVTEAVAERQDRVEQVMARAEAGEWNAATASNDELTGTRRDVADELRLQEEIQRRDAMRRRERRQQAEPAEAVTEQVTVDTGEPVEAEEPAEAVDTSEPEPVEPEPVEPEPVTRPGLAGAAEDYADALRAGIDADRERTLARLQSSLRRSRSDSPLVAQLRDYIEQTPGDQHDPDGIAELARQIRDETRAKRNERARERRKAKRLERERLRNLLGQIDGELRTRGLDPNEYGGGIPLPEGHPDAPSTVIDAAEAVLPSGETSPASTRGPDLAAQLREQPHLILGDILGGDDVELQREAAREAFGPLVEQYGELVEAATDADIDGAKQQVGKSELSEAAAVIAAKQHPRTRSTFVRQMRAATGRYRELLTERRAAQRPAPEPVPAPALQQIAPNRTGYQGRMDVLAARPRAEAPLGSPSFGSARDAIEHLSGLQPPDTADTPFSRSVWTERASEQMKAIQGAREVFLSPGGGILAFRAPIQAHGQRKGRLGWYLVHARSGAHLNTIGSQYSDSTRSMTLPHLAHGLDESGMRRQVAALETLLDPRGQQIDFNADINTLHDQLGQWQDYTAEGELPQPGTGRYDAGINGLMSAATWEAVADDLHHYAGTVDVARAEGASFGAMQTDLTIGGRAMKPLRDHMSIISGHFNHGLRKQHTPGGDRRDRGQLASDKVTGAVVEAARVHTFGGRPHEAVAELRARADALEDTEHDRDPGMVRSQALRGLARDIAEAFTPIPTELQRLYQASPGDRIVTDSTRRHEDGDDPVVLTILSRDDHNGYARETGFPMISMRVRNENLGIEGDLRMPNDASGRVTINYETSDPPTGWTGWEGFRHPLRLTQDADGRWTFVPADEPVPNTVGAMRQRSRRAVEAFEADMGRDLDGTPEPEPEPAPAPEQAPEAPQTATEPEPGPAAPRSASTRVEPVTTRQMSSRLRAADLRGPRDPFGREGLRVREVNRIPVINVDIADDTARRQLADRVQWYLDANEYQYQRHDYPGRIRFDINGKTVHDTSQEPIGLGDVVRIGTGYQEWTVLRDNGDTLTVQSDPSRQSVAGSSRARTREIARERVQLVRHSEPARR